MKIHPTAIVDPTAELDEGVEIGPYAVIGSRVVIGENTRVMAHVFIDSDAFIGKNCRIYPSASVGTEPQDFKYKGERSRVVIGDGVTIREFVSINRATGEGEITSIGDESYLMAYVHVPHNSRIGRQVVLVNNPFIAGHVVIEDGATVSGMVGIHQFVRIGTHAYVGGFCKVLKDVPPYMLCEGMIDFQIHGPNLIGLRRKGFDRKTISTLKNVFRIVFRNDRPLQEVLLEAEGAFPDVPEVLRLVAFFRESKRGVYR